jgi:hypothetical protein
VVTVRRCLQGLTDLQREAIAVMADGQVSGSAMVDSVGNADSIGVTLEPSGGSATPTFPAVTGVTLV